MVSAFTQVPIPPQRIQQCWYIIEPHNHKRLQQRSFTTRNITHRWRPAWLRNPVKDEKYSPSTSSAEDESQQQQRQRFNHENDFKRTHRTKLGSRNKKRQKYGAELYRADRVLANRTGQSRKECFRLLQEKRVYQVLGRDPDKFESSLLLEVVPGPKTRIPLNTPLRIDRKHDVPLPPPLLAVYHKPKWVLSVRRDPIGRPCLDQLYSSGNPWFVQTIGKNPSNQTNDNMGDVQHTDNDKNDTEKSKELLHPVGRLDYDTTGLLLFSSSGTLTQLLLHPKHATEKEYVATVTGKVNEEELRTKLKAGVTTGLGVHVATLISVQHMDTNLVMPYLQSVKESIPTDYNMTELEQRGYLDIFDATEISTVTLTVNEGKHRMVRRVLANCGHPVVSLHRERLGMIRLGDLPEGEIREITDEETKWAQKLLAQQAKIKLDKLRRLAQQNKTDTDSRFDNDGDDDEDNYEGDDEEGDLDVYDLEEDKVQ